MNKPNPESTPDSVIPLLIIKTAPMVITAGCPNPKNIFSGSATPVIPRKNNPPRATIKIS